MKWYIRNTLIAINCFVAINQQILPEALEKIMKIVYRRCRAFIQLSGSYLGPIFVEYDLQLMIVYLNWN